MFLIALTHTISYFNRALTG